MKNSAFIISLIAFYLIISIIKGDFDSMIFLMMTCFYYTIKELESINETKKDK